jgi:hypothetical protein
MFGNVNAIKIFCKRCMCYYTQSRSIHKNIDSRSFPAREFSPSFRIEFTISVIVEFHVAMQDSTPQVKIQRHAILTGLNFTMVLNVLAKLWRYNVL